MSFFLFFTGITAGIIIAVSLWRFEFAESGSKLLGRLRRPRYLQPYQPGLSARPRGKS